MARLRHAASRISAAAAACMRRAEPFGRRYLVKNVMEQAPNPDSRVVLNAARDRLGCPQITLQWSLSAIDKRTMHRAHEIVDEGDGR